MSLFLIGAVVTSTLKLQDARIPELVTYKNIAEINKNAANYIQITDELKDKVSELWTAKYEAEEHLDRVLFRSTVLEDTKVSLTSDEFQIAHLQECFRCTKAFVEFHDAVTEFVLYLKELYGPTASIPTKIKHDALRFRLPDNRLLDLDAGTIVEPE